MFVFTTKVQFLEVSDDELLFLTVIVHCALRPFEVLAVIVAVPAAIAVTLPLLFTVATFLLLEYQVTVVFDVLGEIVALRVLDLPTSRVYLL